ncbi:CxC2 domain-containing protein [Mycena kentingensis (nom. inval.)]|nr:CxC2 domain-containing protein [Mycena kentingensis (nom. inval.)]
MSRREKRRRNEIEDLHASGTIAPLRRPHTQEISFTVTTEASSATSVSSISTAPQLPYLAAVPDPAPLLPDMDNNQPAEAPPLKRRAKLQADFEDHFEDILDALLEHEANPAATDTCSCGRGLLATTQCRDCVGYPAGCSLCFLDRHRCNPFHWAEVWDAQQGFFVRHDISKLDVAPNPAQPDRKGVIIQLGHGGLVCPWPSGETEKNGLSPKWGRY